MTDRQPARCRVQGCNQEVPLCLGPDGLCLDHFVEGTYGRARRAVEAIQKELPLEAGAFEWMFEDTKFALKALVRDSDEDFREGLTELITALANVHEYLHQQTHQQATDQSSHPVHAIEAEMEEYVSRRAAGQGNA